MAAKFKIGDRVKVLRKKYIDYHVKIGGEYTIKGCANMFGDYCYWIHGENPFYYDEDDLELVKPTKSPTLTEVVNLIKEMRIIMTSQGRSGDDISQMAHNICKQYGYDLPEGIEKQ